MHEVILNVEGMTCNHCVMTVTKALASLEGVDDVTVSLEQKTAKVTYNPEMVTIEQMKHAVEEVGYQVV